MTPNLLILAVSLLLTGCRHAPSSIPRLSIVSDTAIINPFARISEIPVPDGYYRVSVEKNSFGDWLRNLPLRKDKTVYLYNGQQKSNQSAQYAVLDVSVGKKDLQQCADAVMRLRAEYLFSLGRWSEIFFQDNNGRVYSLHSAPSRPVFDQYLENVFNWCGTASLEKQLKPVRDLSAIQAGQLFIKGGFPGHAALVVDVAINPEGEKIFLLANSYMPAQDIHIVLNPSFPKLSPWFSASQTGSIRLPEWTFFSHQLREW